MTFLWLLEGIRTPFLDKLMQFITYFGQELIIITFICTLYWCVDKRFAYFLGFSYFTAGLAVQTLKITFRIPRPWVLDPDFHAVESAISGATGYSFPSGHTQGATCLVLPACFKSAAEMGEVSMRHGIFVHRFFPHVSWLPHSKRCAGVYGAVTLHHPSSVEISGSDS